MRKIVTLPFNIIAFIVAIIYVVLIRSKEIAVGIERRIDVFEQNKGKKK